MRIHIITESDPFYIPVFFEEFLAGLDRSRFVLTGVDITRPLGQRTRLRLLRKLLGLYGLLGVARLAARYGRILLLDRLGGGGPHPGTLPAVLGRRGVLARNVADVNEPAYVADLASQRPDLLVSVAASQVFGTPLLAVPRREAINIHTGTLPEYRGMMPVFWQLLDGRRSIGITIHGMTADLDLGDVLLSRTVPLDGERSLDEAIRRMKREGARALLELLGRYADGAVVRSPMDRSREAYHRFPGRRDAAAFRKLGYRLP